MAKQQTISQVNDVSMPNFDVSLTCTVKKALKLSTFTGVHGPFSKQMFVVEDETGSCILDLKNPPPFVREGAVIRITSGGPKGGAKRDTYPDKDKPGEEKGKIVATGRDVELVTLSPQDGQPGPANSPWEGKAPAGGRSLSDAVEAYRLCFDESFDLVADQITRRKLEEISDEAALERSQGIATSLFIAWVHRDISLAPSAAPAPAAAPPAAPQKDSSDSPIDDDDIPF